MSSTTSAIIVNADDFGLTPDANRAIVELASIGVISSTSLMANLPNVETITHLAQVTPKIGIGLHLNLTKGRPITPARSLTDERGEFFGLRELVRRVRRGRINRPEMEAEIRAQFERACALTGDRLDHWNSHEGIHRYEPFASIALNFGRQFGALGMRIHRHSFVVSSTPLEAENAGLKYGARRLLRETYYHMLALRARRYFAVPHSLLVKSSGSILDVLHLLIECGAPEGDRIWEIPCHPAASEEGLTQSECRIDRVSEYNLLKSPEWFDALNSGRVCLTTFGSMADSQPLGRRGFIR